MQRGASLWVFAYLPNPPDVAALSQALAKHPPRVVIFDIHPHWSPSEAVSTVSEETHTRCDWRINCAVLGAPQGGRKGDSYLRRLSGIHEKPDSPLYAMDVYLPQVIADFLTNENRAACFLEGNLHVNAHTSLTVVDPAQIGYLKLPRSSLTVGSKVRMGKGYRVY